MKKAIISIAMALALLVGYNIAPAYAHVLAPYTEVQDQAGTCSVISSYGTFGAGYAKIRFPGFGSCHPNTGVKVATVNNGVYHEKWCFVIWTYLGGNGNGCNLSSTELIASQPGGAFAMEVYLCQSENSCGWTSHAFA